MDSYAEEHGNPFSISAIWQTSYLQLPDLDGKDTLFKPIDIDISSIKLNNPYAPTTELSRDLHLPELDNFQYGPLPVLEEIPDHASTSSISAHDLQPPPTRDEPHPTVDEDIWLSPTVYTSVASPPRLQTWETFHKQSSEEPIVQCISEAGPAAFDTALRVRDSASAGKAVRADAMFRALWHLGLGRTSLLFPLNEAGDFTVAIVDGRASGFSVDAFQSLTHDFLRLGNAIIRLRRFIYDVNMEQDAVAGHVALASAVHSTLSAVENHIVAKIEGVKSFLHLQQLFEQPRRLVWTIRDLADNAWSATSNEEVVSVTFSALQQLDGQYSEFTRILQNILGRVSRPWLDFVEKSIGLCADVGRVETLTDTQETSATKAEHAVEFPTFISEDMKRTATESINCLQFMRKNCPHHPVGGIALLSNEDTTLEWCFGWEDLERVARKVKHYEDALITALCQRGQDGESLHSRLQVPPPRSLMSTAEMEHETFDFSLDIERSTEHLNAFPSSLGHHLPDELQDIISTHFDLTNKADLWPIQPPVSLIPDLSFQPFLRVQHAHLTRSALRSIFHTHYLRQHLSLHHAFHLFSSGTFASRLSYALFSTDAAPAQRQRDVLRTNAHLGLHLGSASRNDWPPTDSETRLALAGVLLDSSPATPPAVLACLSFSLVYPTTDAAALTAVQNPHSIHALDFLSLSYTPPTALAPLFSQSTTASYTRIFAALLRTLRINHAVRTNLHTSLFLPSRHSRHRGPVSSSALRLRAAAHTLVSEVAAHAEASIAAAWTRFSRHLDAVEASLHADAAAPCSSVEALARRHSEMVDAIATAVLAGRGPAQEGARKAWEAVCDCVLAFVAGVQGAGGEEGQVRGMLADFKAKSAAFLEELRGMVVQDGEGGGEGVKGLLERLESAGFPLR